MIKIGYYYKGNKEYIDKLKDYDLTLLIDDEKYVKELLEYNLDIKMIKYCNDEFEILIAETDDLKDIFAIKKVAIGKFKDRKSRIHYLDEFDLDEILKKAEKPDIKFSIIVPNYNNGDWIGKTISSIKKQTYQNWEMYIIDDMSTDNSIEEIKKHNDMRITLIKNQIKLYNGGSRNVGIMLAKETNYEGYLLFVDSDDWLANDRVLEDLNKYIEDEDVITLDYQYYMGGRETGRGRHSYKNKDDLFMTIGSMCAVWCKCFKVSIAPLFEFNTLMEDRNYHYRLINKCKTFSNFGKITHTWNKMNTKSITSDKNQLYNSELQAKIEWDNCAYRHIAGMLDLLNELDNPKYIKFIKSRIEECKYKVSVGVYQQY